MKSMNLNDLFDYGYFIYQNDDYFKFSIDSVLLAEFISLKKGKNKIIDLCSGNAPVPMILNKKFGNEISITAVEIQEEIYELGLKSLDYNKIDNVRMINADVNYLSSVLKGEKFDIVSCNPPYFKVTNNELVNDNKVKAIARHEIMLNLDDLIHSVAKLIENQGYFYMVHSITRLTDVINTLHKYNFGVKRLVFVHDTDSEPANLFLIESVFNGKDYVRVEKPIFLKNYDTYKNIFER